MLNFIGKTIRGTGKFILGLIALWILANVLFAFILLTM